MVDLRPCPFCGNNVRLEDREFDDFAGNFFTNTMSVIECKKCGISMKRHPKRGYGITDKQKQDLINSWNRRTELSLLKEQEAEWIEYPECLAYDGAYSDSHIVCSACKHVFSTMDNCTEEFDYCPHCGAKMKQEGR